MDTKEQVWERLKKGAPTSVIIEETGKHHTFVCSFLNHFKQELVSQQFLSVIIDCTRTSTAIDFWRTLGRDVHRAVLPVIDDSIADDIEEQHTEIEQAGATLDIKAAIAEILDIIKENTSHTVLIVLENIATALDYQEENDMMKIRALTSNAAIMAVSDKELDTLALEHYSNPYFCNQFVPPFHLSI